MASGTTFNPNKTADFERTKLTFNAQGVSATATAGTTTNIDLTMTDDCLLTGAWLVTHNGAYGDNINFQIVDGAGAFTGIPGTVILQAITNWSTPPTTDVQVDMVYPAKIYTGLTLRIVYTSTGESDAFVAINYKLHKVLV